MTDSSSSRGTAAASGRFLHKKGTKTAGITCLLLAVLLFAELISGAVLYSRVSSFIVRKNRHYIALNSATSGTEFWAETGDGQRLSAVCAPAEQKLSASRTDDAVAAVRSLSAGSRSPAQSAPGRLLTAGLRSGLASSQQSGIASSQRSGLASGQQSGLASSQQSGIASGLRSGLSSGLSDNGQPRVRSFLSAGKPGAEVVDQAGLVWKTKTDIDLFRYTYVDGEGAVTVRGNGSGKEKLIAPGTSGSYTFTLKNTGSDTLSYTVVAEAYLTGSDITLPLEARITPHGSSVVETWSPLSQMSTVEQTGWLSAGYVADYSFEWRWPYSKDNPTDRVDTVFGENQDDLTVTLVIRTVAQSDGGHTDPGGEPDAPETGDSLIFWLTSMLFWLLLLLILMAAEITRRLRKNAEEDR